VTKSKHLQRAAVNGLWGGGERGRWNHLVRKQGSRLLIKKEEYESHVQQIYLAVEGRYILQRRASVRMEGQTKRPHYGRLGTFSGGGKKTTIQGSGGRKLTPPKNFCSERSSKEEQRNIEAS